MIREGSLVTITQGSWLRPSPFGDLGGEVVSQLIRDIYAIVLETANSAGRVHVVSEHGVGWVVAARVKLVETSSPARIRLRTMFQARS